MKAAPPPELTWLYQAALLCKEFPAYRLEDVLNMPGSQLRRLMTAVKLVETARTVLTTNG